jgi:hypothetical protein
MMSIPFLTMPNDPIMHFTATINVYKPYCVFVYNYLLG